MQLKRFSVVTLVYAGAALGLATALSYFKFPISFWPQGGSVTLCSMFFVALVGWWFGAPVGFCAAVAYGLLQFVLDGYALNPVNLLLDYPLAFGALGIMGLFRRWKHPAAMYVGFGAAALGRFCFSFTSGRIFYAAFVPEGWGATAYSAVYNLGYILPEVILTYIIISLPPVKAAIGKVAPRG